MSVPEETGRAGGGEAAERLLAEQHRIAELATERFYTLRPDLAQLYGAAGRARCLEDARFHLQHLAGALSADSTVLFLEYVGWARATLAHRGIPGDDLEQGLRALGDAILQALPLSLAEAAWAYLELGVRVLPQ